MTAVLLITSLGAPAAEDAAPLTPREVVARFVEHVGNHQGYPHSAKRFVQQQWQQRRDGPGLQTFIPEALAVLHPRFKAGLDAFEAGEYAYCARIMGDLSLGADAYLGSHAALFQVKAQVREINLEYAAMVLNFYLREDFRVVDYCLSADELRFLQGYCRYHTFDNAAAREALEIFIRDFPNAPPDLRVAAREMLQSLQSPKPKNLDTVAHLMADAGLWLTEGRAGLEVQTRQKKALLLLEEMIRNAEQQQQQSQASQSSGAGGQSAQGTQAPTSPAQQSAAEAGPTRQGQQHVAPRAAPGETWGRMKPRERARIMQVLQDSFPSRYRELVEQYYEQLSGEE